MRPADLIPYDAAMRSHKCTAIGGRRRCSRVRQPRSSSFEVPASDLTFRMAMERADRLRRRGFPHAALLVQGTALLSVEDGPSRTYPRRHLATTQPMPRSVSRMPSRLMRPQGVRQRRRTARAKSPPSPASSEGDPSRPSGRVARRVELQLGLVAGHAHAIGSEEANRKGPQRFGRLSTNEQAGGVA